MTYSKFYPTYYRFYFLSMLLVLSSLLISCVTINIYFPAAAAEKVAEQIVDGVLRSDVPKKKKEDSNDQGFLNSVPYHSQNVVLAIVDFIIPTVQAAQADLSINSPRIRAIRNSMEKRQSKLSPYYNSGAVGFTNNGLIASVTNKGLSVKKKSSVQKLIKAENKDRKALYSEIANANKHPEWKADIQKTFAKTWLKKISSGWMYQSPSGKWLRK